VKSSLSSILSVGLHASVLSDTHRHLKRHREVIAILSSWKSNLVILCGIIGISLNLLHYRTKMNRKDINIFHWLLLIILVPLFLSCNKPGIDFASIDREAMIHPFYQGTVIPYNIAPLNFMIREEGSRFMVRFAIAGKDSFDVSCNSHVSIPLRKWKKLLGTYRGQQMDVSVFVKKSSGWIRYAPLRFAIAPDPVDPWLAYRLIEPGYEAWDKMGIYQRCLENFEESPIMVNTLTGGSCMNCHSFCRNDPKTMLFHIKGNGVLLISWAHTLA